MGERNYFSFPYIYFPFFNLFFSVLFSLKQNPTHFLLLLLLLLLLRTTTASLSPKVPRNPLQPRPLPQRQRQQLHQWLASQLALKLAPWSVLAPGQGYCNNNNSLQCFLEHHWINSRFTSIRLRLVDQLQRQADRQIDQLSVCQCSPCVNR